MVKKCKVVSYNKFLNILVFDYENKQIQTTFTIDESCDYVYVKYKNNKYEIVCENEYEKYIRDVNKKKEINSDKKAEITNSEL